MTRAVVTGSTGFTGRHLLAELEARGIEAVRVSLRRHGPGVTTVRLASRGAWEELLGGVGPDLVFHLHGSFEGEDASELVRHNVAPAAALLDAAARVGSRASILLVGSAAEYGPLAPGRGPVTEDAPLRPTTLLGVTKAAQTGLGLAAARTRGLVVVVARPANLVGPGAAETTAVGAFAARLADVAAGRARVVRVGPLDTTRDLVDVRDAVRAYVALALAPRARGQVVHVATGRATPMREVFLGLARRLGVSCPVEEDPALGPARSADQPAFTASVDRLRDLVGEVPATPLSVTLDDVARAVEVGPGRAGAGSGAGDGPRSPVV